MDLNWEQLDKQNNYKYFNDRLEIAKNLGYNFISEATVKLYRKHKSTTKVANLLKLSTAGVLSEIKKCGEPKMKRGGCRFSTPLFEIWDAKTFDDKKFKLGTLCHRKHDWNNTGNSLRYKYRSGSCIKCIVQNYNKRYHKK